MPNPIKTIIVYRGEKYDAGFPSENLAEFAEWIAARLAGIPAAKRAAATIELTTVESYDCHHPHIEIAYRREMTDEEVAAAAAESRAHLEARERTLRHELALIQQKKVNP